MSDHFFADFEWDVFFTLEPDIPEPKKATEGSAGYDLVSRLTFDPEKLHAWPEALRRRDKETILLPLGIHTEFNSRLEGGLVPRSSHATWLFPATIDSDYRGEICIQAHESRLYRVEKGERIAQLVMRFAPRTKFTQCDRLSPSARGNGGFGHTGKK